MASQRFRISAAVILLSTICVVATASSSTAAGRRQPQGAAETGFDWPEYGHDIAASGFTTDSDITAEDADTLADEPGFPLHAANNSVISAQPVEANGLIYWGSWDGVEHASPVGGGSGGWTARLGTTSFPSTNHCGTRPQGIADAPAIGTVTVTGGSGPQSVAFVGDGGNDTAGGGFARMYALDALTGKILWTTNLAPAPTYYIWSSPLLFTPAGQAAPSVYLGVSARGDGCGAARGEVVKLDAASGAVQSTFFTVPAGCLGASVWGSLTVDAAAGTVYGVTGNGYSCQAGEPESYAIVKLAASDLSLLDHWQLPKSDRFTGDDDFGTVPILFSGTVTPSGAARQLVGATNKNGIFYVWDRANLAAGPVARLTVATPAAQNIAPAAFDGTTLYVASRNTKIGATGFAGSVRAFNPDNLATPIWQTGLAGHVWASVAAAPGIVVVGASKNTVVLNAATGAVLKNLPVLKVSGSHGLLYGAPSISDGVIYEGDTLGQLYAYSPEPE